MRCAVFVYRILYCLCFEVADVFFLGRVESEIANRRHQAVDAQRDYRKEYVRQSSRLKTFGL